MNARIPVLVAALLLAAVDAAAQEKKQVEYWRDALPLTLEPYRKNYFLFASMDSDLSDQPSSVPNGENQDTEVKFQVSLRSTLWNPGDAERSRLYFGYTALSHWQIYDTDHSSPFRTTDHEPELFWQDRISEGIDYYLGVSHQSNGEGGAESRSWNRLFMQLRWNGVTEDGVREQGDWGLFLKGWVPFKVEHNNDDISEYLGYFELYGEKLFHGPRDQLLTLLARTNLVEGRGYLEANYSLRVWGKLRGIVQACAGYGESLLDYDENARRIGFGLEFWP